MLAMITALCAAAALLLLLLRFAAPLGLLDEPDARKVHAHATPLIGGLAWIGGTLIAALIFSDAPQQAGLLSALCAMALLGALDDRFHLPSIPRLIIQVVIVACVTQFDGVLLVDLGSIFGTEQLHLREFSWAFTVFALVGVINAMNMIDGVDGLSGSLALLILATLSILSWQSNFALALLLAMSAAALLPFLALNLRLPWRSRASVFLGDAGSMALGLLIGYSMVVLSQGKDAAFPPSAALWLFAVPLIDTVSVMLRRLAQRKSPFQPDQQHVHHLLLRAGFSVTHVVLLLFVAQAVCLGFGVLGPSLGIPDYLQVLIFVTVGLCYHGLVGRALRSGRLLGRVLLAQLQRA